MTPKQEARLAAIAKHESAEAEAVVKAAMLRRISRTKRDSSLQEK